MKARPSYLLVGEDGRTVAVACVEDGGGWTCFGVRYAELEDLAIAAQADDLELRPLFMWRSSQEVVGA